MSRTVEEIHNEILDKLYRSAWDTGVKYYAVDLFDAWAGDCKGYNWFDDVTDKVTEKELLNGASNWDQYSWGGCALIYDQEICERLCPDWEIKKKDHGNKRPNRDEEWLDVQARALAQASKLVRRIVNRRD